VKSGRAKGLGYFEIKNGFKEDMISYRKELFFLYFFYVFFILPVLFYFRPVLVCFVFSFCFAF